MMTRPTVIQPPIPPFPLKEKDGILMMTSPLISTQPPGGPPKFNRVRQSPLHRRAGDCRTDEKYQAMKVFHASILSGTSAVLRIV
jgi:hypothetical protein